MIKLPINKVNKKAFDVLKSSIGVEGMYNLDKILYSEGKLISTNSCCMTLLNVDSDELQDGLIYTPTFTKDFLNLEVNENASFPDYKRVINISPARSIKIKLHSKVNAFNSFLTSTSPGNTIYNSDLLESFVKYAFEQLEVKVFHGSRSRCKLECENITFVLVGMRNYEFEEIEGSKENEN